MEEKVKKILLETLKKMYKEMKDTALKDDLQKFINETEKENNNDNL